MTKLNIREENEKQFKNMYENFNFLRQANGWSVEELSKISGIDKKILSDIEEGKDYDIKYLIELCCIYDVKPYNIFSCW